MFNACAIVKLLLDDEVPAQEPPGNFQPVDGEDPQATLDRYLTQPFSVRGVPVTLYQDWTKILRGRSSRYLRDIFGWRGRVTLTNTGESINLRLHGTDIVSVTPENKVTVTTGGYQTRTTISKINWAAPGGWCLFVFKENMYWCNYSVGAGYSGDNRLLPFTDGDVIEPDGRLVMQATPEYRKTRKAKA